MDPRYHQPGADELEVSIFGPGYGECILVHIGNGRWLIVDSCIDPYSRLPVALTYLRRLGLDPKDAVDLIVATHWHDDHVAGLAQVVCACSNAQVCCSAALHSKEFLALANLYQQAPTGMPSGPTEFAKVFEEILSRKGTAHYRPIKWCRSDQVIWRTNLVSAGDAIDIRVSGLSPSDEMITRSFGDMARLFAQATSTTNLSLLLPLNPNHIAVAIQIEVGETSMLLGSDLQDTGDPLIGWAAVLTSTARPPARSELLKIAHHGSANGHNLGVWGQMVRLNPVSLLTPFRWGRHKIPSAGEIAAILAQTNQAFITAHPATQVPSRAKRSPKVERLINSSTTARGLATGPVGHVRWRKEISGVGGTGTVEKFDGAIDLAAAA